MSKVAFITGITGQDGAYLSELLLKKGYKVYGGYRRISTPNFWRLDELKIRDKVSLVELDMLDQGNLIRIISTIQPDEIYNLAAQSFVGVSFENPVLTSQVTAIGVTNILEAIRIINPKIKFYQASSSEMFGKVQSSPQNENTLFYPRSPYGVAKLYGHWITINYKESFNIFGCSGILFNHESPLRGMEFVTRKITDAVAKIHFEKLDCLHIGNLNSRRDWGYAPEYVEAMWLMLQQEIPDNYVIATERMYSVRDFVELSFSYIGKKIIWEGEGIDEIGKDKESNKIVVRVDKKFFRPSEVDYLIGDCTKAKNKLNWRSKTTFENLVGDMISSDIRRQKNSL